MAALDPIRVRDLTPPEDAVPPEVWARIVAELGDLVLATWTTLRCTASARLMIRAVPDEAAIAKVNALYQELTGEPWERDADWWKA